MIQPGPVGRSAQIPPLPSERDLHPTRYQAQCIFSFARTAITRYHRLKQQKFIFSQFWRLEVWDQGVCGVGPFWGLSSWLADDNLLPVSSFGLSSVHVYVQRYSSFKDTSCIGLGPALLTPNTVTFWSLGVGISTFKFWRDTIQPITLIKVFLLSNTYVFY